MRSHIQDKDEAIGIYIELLLFNYLALTGLAIKLLCFIKIRFEHFGHLTPGSNLSSLGVISFLHLWQIYLVIVFTPFPFFLFFSV